MSENCVICGVADADSGARVARAAAHLGAALDASLVLVHVAEVAPTILYGVPFDSDSFQRENLARSRALLEDVVARCGLADAEQRVEWGSAGTALLDLAAREEALLIVIGTRGRAELKAAVLGSVSHRVTAEAPCPVVVVPPNARSLPD